MNENGKMIITLNNDNIVIVKIEEYRKKLMKEDIEKHLLKAEDDIKNGRVREAREDFASFNKVQFFRGKLMKKKKIIITIVVILLVFFLVMFRKNLYVIFIKMKSNIVIEFVDSTASRRYYYIDEKNNIIYYVDDFKIENKIYIVKSKISDEKIKIIKEYKDEPSPYKEIYQVPRGNRLV